MFTGRIVDLRNTWRKYEPFGDDKHLGHSLYRVAADPKPITPEFGDEFVDRWIELFAQVAETDFL